MNRAQRRQPAKATKAKPGRGRADPFAYLRTIEGLQHLPDSAKADLCLPVRMAYEALRTGTATEGDIDTLAVAINASLMRAEKISSALVVRVIEAQEAVLRIKARQQRTGRFGLDAQAMAELLPVIDLYEQLIDLSTRAQMADAIREVMARRDRGQFFTTKEQA